MKVSKKRLFQIDLALNAAVRETLELYIPDISSRPPEDWNDREKIAFDAVSHAQHALAAKIKELFTT